MMDESCANAVSRIHEMRRDSGNTDEIIDVATSFDGSWGSRAPGHQSRDGVVAAIADETCQVVDAVFLSRSCAQCTTLKCAYEEGKLTNLEYNMKCIEHEIGCLLNHDGSAQVIFIFILKCILP